MRELGGYLELEHFHGSEYHDSALRFNTVRNSIEYVITRKQYSKIYIPHYLCHSVKDMLDKIKFPYEFYTISDSFLPQLDKKAASSEVVLIVNYFGLLDNMILIKLQKEFGNILVDNTHAFFQLPVKGIDSVYTCRKFFGVPDGAYLYAAFNTADYGDLERDVSMGRMEHLLGRFEHSASQYYHIFSQNDDDLSNQKILKMSALTQNILQGIDYKYTLKHRTENFICLDQALSAYNRLSHQKKLTYMYPLLHPMGSQIKKRLIARKIYVPTLWPNVLNDCSAESFEYYLADNLVLLPIDQRYSTEDMDYIAAEVLSIIHDLP